MFDQSIELSPFYCLLTVISALMLKVFLVEDVYENH